MTCHAVIPSSNTVLTSSKAAASAGESKTSTPAGGGGDLAASAFTLSPRQQFNLASLVSFTTSSSEEDEEECLEDLVRLVDSVFTTCIPSEVRDMMSDRDSGISRSQAKALLSELESKLSDLPKPSSCSKFDDAFHREAVRAFAISLIKSCEKGKAANFQVFESMADAILLGTLGESFANSGFLFLLVLAFSGAFLLMDRLILTRILFSPLKIPCACPICEKQITCGEEIGRGGFGRVLRCLPGKRFRPGVVGDIPTDRMVLKAIPVDLEKDINLLQDAIREAQNLVKLKHKHIVGLGDVFIHRSACHGQGWWPFKAKNSNGFGLGEGQDDQHHDVLSECACIIMEYCEGGALVDLTSTGITPCSFDVLMASVYQLASALAYMHERNKIHCDIKLENVFIARTPSGTEWQLKIGDLGLTSNIGLHHPVKGAAAEEGEGMIGQPFSGRRSISCTSLNHGSGNLEAELVAPVGRRGKNIYESETMICDLSAIHGGTLPYQPPECFESLPIGPAVDVWGLACVIYELVTCTSLPMARPFLGQLARTRRWEEQLLDSMILDFEERLTSMLAVLNAEKRKVSSKEKLQRERAKQGLVKLLRQMFSKDAFDRPRLADVCQMDFLAPFVDVPFRMHWTEPRKMAVRSDGLDAGDVDDADNKELIGEISAESQDRKPLLCRDLFILPPGRSKSELASPLPVIFKEGSSFFPAPSRRIRSISSDVSSD